MGKSSNMSSKAASRIQSHTDRSGRNQSFKSRAQSAASRNASKAQSSGGGSKKK